MQFSKQTPCPYIYITRTPAQFAWSKILYETSDTQEGACLERVEIFQQFDTSVKSKVKSGDVNSQTSRVVWLLTRCMVLIRLSPELESAWQKPQETSVHFQLLHGISTAASTVLSAQSMHTHTHNCALLTCRLHWFVWHFLFPWSRIVDVWVPIRKGRKRRRGGEREIKRERGSGVSKGGVVIRVMKWGAVLRVS